MANKATKINYIGIGKRIQTRRKSKKLSQSQLSTQINVTSKHLSCIENGSQGISFETFVSLCDALDVSPDYLLLGNMHGYDIPKDIIENLRLCSPDDIELIQQQLNFMVERNNKKNAEEKYIDRTSAYNKKKK
ncbi:MAG: helix-turn-helix domain-containing protein [Lachnospiraceae bacterium]|nr:helix-turn-helix domain-containing protein [Lachnospiraceae bacterium]